MPHAISRGQERRKERREKEEKKLKEQEKDVQEIAVNLEVPRKTPKGTIVLRGATVVTMKGDEVLKNADVVIENNRIKSVGAKGSVPAGAKVFEVGGKTIVPGFVDTHAHWTEIRRGILDTQNWSFLANLAYGVTAGLDVQNGHERHVCLPGSRRQRRHPWVARIFNWARRFPGQQFPVC